MIMLLDVLAQAGVKSSGRACPLSGWLEQLVPVLCVATAILVLAVFLRQRKIAQNQVELAELIKGLLERK